MNIEIDISSILAPASTYLTSSVSSGSSIALPVLNSSGFAANDLVTVGLLGQEKTEIRTLSTIGSTISMTVNSIAIAHPANTFIQKVYFDQVVIERSTDGGSSYTALTTLSISGDQTKLQYFDATGSTTYYYRAYFHNSVTSTDSNASNVFSPTDPSVVDIIIDRFIDKIESEGGKAPKRRTLLYLLSEADMRIARSIVLNNDQVYKLDYDIALISGQQDYILPKNYQIGTRVMVNFDSTQEKKESELIDINYGAGGESFSKGFPKHSIYQKNSDRRYYLRLRPTPESTDTGEITVTYLATPVPINAMTDTLNTPTPLMFADVLMEGMKTIYFADYLDNQNKAEYARMRFEEGTREVMQITGQTDNSESVHEMSADAEYIFDNE